MRSNITLGARLTTKGRRVLELLNGAEPVSSQEREWLEEFRRELTDEEMSILDAELLGLTLPEEKKGS